MAIIKLDGGYNALPISYKRGNPIPLDTTAVWYDIEALRTYAREGVTAYVGQVLTHVDTTNHTAIAYVIENEAGNLKPIGTVPVGDDGSITVVDGKIQIVGFKDVDDNGFMPVSKVTKTDGEVTDRDIVWQKIHYEISSAKDSENKPNGVLSISRKITERVVGEDGAVSYPTRSEVVQSNVTAASLGLASTDALNQAIANSSHLVAEVVDISAATSGTTEIEKLASVVGESPSTSKIYLVKDEDAKGADKYNEYLYALTEENTYGFVMIGDTSTDLSNYYTKDEVYTTGEADELFVTKAMARGDSVDGTAGAGVRFITNDEISKLSKLDLEDGNLTISGSVAAGSVNGLGEAIEKAVTGKDGGFDSVNLGIEAGAEKNIIEAVKLNGTATTVSESDRSVNINAATSISVNNTTPTPVDSDGKISLNGLVTSATINVRDTDGTLTSSSITPTNGNLDLTSLATNARVGAAEQSIGTINDILSKTEEVTGEDGQTTTTTTGLLVDVASLKVTTSHNSGRLDALEELHKDSDLKLSVVQKHITDSEAKLINHENRLKAIEETDGFLYDSISEGFENTIGLKLGSTADKNVHTRISDLEGWKTNTVDGHIADVGTKTDASDATTLFGRVKKAEDTIGTSGDNASESGTLFARIKNNKESIDAIKEWKTNTVDPHIADVGTKTDASTATTLFGRVKKNEEELAGVDSKINTAISNAGHLKREFVYPVYQNIPDPEYPDMYPGVYVKEFLGFSKNADSAVADIVGETNVIYMVKDVTVETGDRYTEYMYIDGSYEIIGSSDAKLSDYVTKTALSNELANNYVSNTQFDTKISEHTTEFATNNIVPINNNITRIDEDLLSRVKTITLAGDTTKLAVDTTGNIDIPLALKEKAGLVKSSDANNQVSVGTDGTMTVNSLDVSRLVQVDAVELILDGGSAGATNA